MPHSFTNWSQHARPGPQLFSVPPPAPASHGDSSSSRNYDVASNESLVSLEDLEELISGIVDETPEAPDHLTPASAPASPKPSSTHGPPSPRSYRSACPQRAGTSCCPRSNSS